MIVISLGHPLVVESVNVVKSIVKKAFLLLRTINLMSYPIYIHEPVRENRAQTLTIIAESLNPTPYKN